MGLIAQELVSVQPLSAPIGMFHYLEYKYPSYTKYPDGTIVLKRRNRKPNNKLML